MDVLSIDGRCRSRRVGGHGRRVVVCQVDDKRKCPLLLVTGVHPPPGQVGEGRQPTDPLSGLRAALQNWVVHTGALLPGPIRQDSLARLFHASLDADGPDTSVGFRKQVAVFVRDLHLVFPHKAVFGMVQLHAVIHMLV
jgi:hypothetical protein